MIKRFFIVALIIITVLYSCKNRREENCDLRLLTVNSKDNVIHITTTTNIKHCRGLFIKVKTSNSSYMFFANNTDRIINNAVPLGFSIRKNSLPYVSLGVVKNITKKKSYSVYLLPSTSDAVRKGKRIINWEIFAAKPIKTIEIKATDGTTVTAKKNNLSVCKRVYLNILSYPDTFSKNIQKYQFPPFSDFKTICLEQFSIDGGKRKPKVLFTINKDILKKAMDEKKRDIALFLARKFGVTLKKEDVKNRLESNTQKKCAACSLRIIPVDSLSFKKLNPQLFSFTANKINTERTSIKLSCNTSKLDKGTYVVEARSEKYYGKSRAINCNCGFVYVVIPVFYIHKRGGI